MESSDDEVLYYCVPPRCRLCRFPFAQGATIIAGKWVVDEPERPMLIEGGMDGRLSSWFPYDSVSHHDECLRSSFRACSNLCHHYYGKAPGYHVECLRFASPPSCAFLRATEYTFEPMPFEDRRRFSRIQSLLGNRLERECARLPIEVRFMVAGELVRECAISTVQELWHACYNSDGDIDISQGVWARYIHIDGVRYVASLSNMDGPGCAKLLDINIAAKIEVFYVLEDHLGIRQLVFASPGHSAKLPSLRSPKIGLWWRTISLGSKLLRAKSDVRCPLASATNTYKLALGLKTEIYRIHVYQ